MGFGFLTPPYKFLHTVYFESNNLYLLYLHEPRPDGLI